MTATVERPTTPEPRPENRLRQHLRVPLHRAGYSLVANAVMTSGLGLVFWAVAARRFSPAAVGATGALLAAMRLISHVADLGLRTGIVRFLPALRDRARALVLGTYAVTGAVAALAATVFVLVQSRWFDDLTLLERPAGAALFIGATSIWVVFVIQDSVLVGLRRASWVPVENGLYGLVKLGLLVLAVASFPQWGIYVAWVAPLPLLVFVVGALIVGREIPALQRQPSVERADLGDLARYSAGDYGGSLLWHATLEIMPLMVLAIAGATESAYYTLSATIAMSLYLIPSSVGYAFVAEAAHDPTSEAINLRRAAKQSIMLVAPAALVVVLGAPFILGILGPEYRGEASDLLRLLAASAVPQVATSLTVNLHRARREVGRVVRLYAFVCVAVLGPGIVLVGRYGATGAGLAWLIAQTLVAITLLATTLRETWISALPTRVLRLLGQPPRLAAAAWYGRLARRRAIALLGAEADRCAVRVVQASRDEAVLVLDDAHDDSAVLKLAGSGRAEAGRRREHHVLSRLHADPHLGEWRRLVPHPRRAVHDHTGDAWFAESYLSGRPGTELVAAGEGDDAVAAGLRALAPLHRSTARARSVDDELLRTWLHRPVERIVARLPHVEDGLHAVVDELEHSLLGRVVVTASCHGDLHAANLVFHPEAAEVVGIVDWVNARDDLLPEVDALNLMMTARADREHAELGALVAGLAVDEVDDEVESHLRSLPSASANADLPLRTLALLTWIDHLHINLANSSQYEQSQAWVLRNVDEPLTRLLAHRRTRATVTAVADPVPPLEAVEPEVTEETGAPVEPPTATRGRPDGLDAALGLTALVGGLVWWRGFETLDPTALGGLGPVADLPPWAYVGPLLVLAGFAVALSQERLREGWLALHLGALVAMLYAVPVVVYGTARYSWAWKHVGIVDYIDRFAAVDPNAATGDVYHNWPGFFAASEVLAELTGADPISFARWAPVLFSLAFAVASWFVLRALTEDTRLVWLGTWLAVLVNWVGQEYFSPQATAMVLYLVVLGLALRLDPHRRGSASIALVVLALVAALASSHQLTPVMLTVALTGLVLIGRRGVGPLALFSGLFTAAWAVWVAFAFVGPELRDEAGSLGSVLSNAGENLVDTNEISADQALVSTVGRAMIAVAIAGAIVGVLRAWRSGRLSVPALWLLVAPGFIIAFNDFGGEILLRAVLFGSPLIGFFAAVALLGPESRAGLGTAVAAVAVSAVLLGGFLVAHFGKDGHYVFSPDEVAAATWVADNAPEGSLLVEGSPNYPKQFRNYEFVRYVPIEREDPADRQRIAEDPAEVLSDWLTDPDDTDAFLLITESQKAEMAALGIAPAGLLDRIEEALRTDPRFAIAYENADAVVFESTERPS